MLKTNFTLFLLLMLLLSSCKKKQDTKSQVAPSPPAQTKFDTIKPLPYFPVYPGSYWKYSDGTTFTTSLTYVKAAYQYNYLNSQGNSQTYISSTVYVPLYNNSPFWGYKHYSPYRVLFGDSPLVPILTDSAFVGNSWTTGYGDDNNYYYSRVKAVNDTVQILGVNYYPTIVIEDFFVPNMANHHVSTEYYVKGIGLMKTETYGGLYDTYAGQIYLVDYHINK